MSNFPFLGHPSLQQIAHLKEYLDTRYASIDLHIEALQIQYDNLAKVLAELQQAEQIIASEEKFNKNASVENVIKAPTQNEDLSQFELFKYDNTETASLIENLLKPWQPNMRAKERIAFKIKKIVYLMEQKGLEIQILNNLKDDLKDDGETS